ncbi:SAM-dependent methyltransferase [Pleomorphomonas diazotrophica]|uniref:S-adenosyl-L-methionine-dependent methyltransferase n=1 Tax=Pleomorphomonas diazotrophica TaxID=1166257 RepID=A0A1I4SXZ3_9HYPH|nr:SAM-dependent methyltransferase [Pleomorphomonas diazotrophica]PKR88615.1 SAM-dependent methyltransferase [Pleomorphomonas diazotrophica]SFM69332.1 methyltransferase, TIGR00027 family [Pleomorphomonas diazotrophica]
MQIGTASATALVTAALRVAHQSYDDGRVFRDPFAEDMLGPEGAPLMMGLPIVPGYRTMRFLMAARSRYAEDALAEAVARGCRQVVLLGAGLDTLSLRNPHRGVGLRIFELDHPATQADKRRRLLRFGPKLPLSLSLVPVIFGEDDIAAALTAAGWRADEPTFFQMLGVVVYLPAAIRQMLFGFVARLPDSDIVLDYSTPPESQSPEGRAVTEAQMIEAAKIGEPWLGLVEPEALAREFADLGLTDIEDLDLTGLRQRYLGETPQGTGDLGPHVLRARRPT